MNKKLNSKNSNKWFSILILFTICISSLSILSNLPNNESDKSNENERILDNPRESSISRNTSLTITGINQTHTVRGSSFALSGYTEKVISGSFVNTSGLPVYPIIDGHLCDGSDSNLVLYPNLTVLSSNINAMEGQFSILINVPDDYDYTSDIGVLANISDIPIQGILVNSFTVQNSTLNHDITTTTQLTIDTGTDTSPVMPGDQFTLSMILEDSTGTGLNSPSTNFTVLTNGTVNTSYSISSSGGSGDVLITEEFGLTSVGVEFLGMDSKTIGPETYFEYEGNITSETIVTVESISGDVNITNSNDSTQAFVFTNGTFLVSGSIWANDNSALKLSNRDIEILFNGHSILTTTTGANGIISENFTLEDISFYDYETDTDITITINLLDYDTTLYTTAGSFSIITTPILVKDAPIPLAERLNNWWMIALPILGVAVLVAGIVIFQRKRMEAASKLDSRLRTVDKSAKFAIITMLYSQGRKREAIAYTYKIYTDLINEKYSLERSNAQTLREFAIICVMKYGLDPLRVYPYIAMIEDVIYGAYEVDRKIFDKAITLFGRIFQEITGVLLAYNLSISEHTNLEQMTLKVSIPEVKTKKIGEN